MKSFKLSQRYLDHLYWTLVIYWLLFGCMMVLLVFVRLDFDLDRFNRIFSLYARVLFAFGYAVLFGSFLFAGYYTRQILKRKYRLELGPGNMVLSTGITRTESAWRDIGTVKILTNAKGRPITIKIWSRSFSRPLRLAGLEDMPDLVRTIGSTLPSGMSIETGRSRLNWDSPWAILFIPPILGGLYFTLFELGPHFGWSPFEFMSTLLLISAGVLFRFMRPISKADSDYAKWNILIAALFLIAVAFLLWGWIG